MKMQESEFKALKKKFDLYTKGFVDRAENPEPYLLKQIHTNRVCQNMEMLIRDQSPDGSIIWRGMTAALFHDIGRFSQFETHATFSDGRSENHGSLGVKVIKKKGFLRGLAVKERHQILGAVALHNAFHLPRGLDSDILLFTRLLRDADKIDIFRVMVDLYQETVFGEKSFITHGIEDNFQVSQSLVEQILSGQVIDARQVVYLNDLKLFQISWVLDLNFPVAVQAVTDAGFIPAILASMPPSKELSTLEAWINQYMEKAIGQIGFQVFKT